jgi:hypothetical protein
MVITKKKFGNKWVLTKVIKGPSGSICSLSFNYLKKIFATGSLDSKICIWNMNSFENLSIFNNKRGTVQSIIFDEKYDHIFSGGNDSLIRQWDIKSNCIIRKYTGHVSSIIKLIKHPVLNVLISGSRDNTIRLWDSRVQKEITILHGHKNVVTSLLYYRESPHLISGSLDDNVCFWDLVSNKNLLTLKNKDNGVKEICKLNNDEIFSVLSSGAISFYRRDGLIIQKITNRKNRNNCFTISVNNNIAVGCSRGLIKCTNFYNKNGWFLFKPFICNLFGKNQNQNLAIGFNQNENQLFTVGNKNNILIFSKRWFVFE